MSIKQSLIAEIEQEAQSTKKHLERVPTDQFDWSPHEKSMNIKDLAAHIADITGMPALILTRDEFDLTTAKQPEIKTTEDIVKLFETGYSKTMEALTNTTNEEFTKNWVLRHGDHILMDLPKGAIIRSMGLNHLYHHRAQLGVYLRLLGQPVPSTYGPSADEE